MNSAARLLTPDVMRVVRCEARHAWRSLRRFGMERGDLRQEFLLRLVENHSTYSLRRASPATFSRVVCRSRTLQLVETATCEKRGGGTVPTSLSEPLNLPWRESTFAELGDILSDDDGKARTGRRSRSTAELLGLRLDVERVVGSLPVELVAVVNLLAAGESVTDVARHLGISRATANRRLAALRCAFRQTGLDRYLDVREAA